MSHGVRGREAEIRWPSWFSLCWQFPWLLHTMVGGIMLEVGGDERMKQNSGTKRNIRLTLLGRLTLEGSNRSLLRLTLISSRGASSVPSTQKREPFQNILSLQNQPSQLLPQPVLFPLRKAIGLAFPAV